MVQELIKEKWCEVVEYEYSLHIAVVLGILIAIFGGREGYQWYVASRERAAQIVMAEAFEEYEKALYNAIEQKDSKELSDQKFEDAKIAFDVVIRQHAGSLLVPYAFAFQADIALQKGDRKTALNMLEAGISKMSSGAPAYYLLKTKYALVTLDDGQVEQALSELHALTTDTKNPNADTAAFYLGYYYWTKQDATKAREVWKLLEAFDKKNTRSTSPWLSLVKAKLQQIS